MKKTSSDKAIEKEEFFILQYIYFIPTFNSINGNSFKNCF